MHNILVAEDEDILRRNLIFILNSSGYSAVPARTTAEGIALLKKRNFDVVVTDLVMPVNGGSELISFVYENCSETAVIIITAYPTTDSAINAVKQGVSDYFTKPFKTEDLLESIKRVIEEKKEVPFTWEKLSSFGVTKREESILRLILEEGAAENKEIAERLSIKSTTVKQHMENLCGKFGTKNRTSLLSAVVRALRK